jgi:hypothetical protein
LWKIAIYGWHYTPQAGQGFYIFFECLAKGLRHFKEIRMDEGAGFIK